MAKFYIRRREGRLSEKPIRGLYVEAESIVEANSIILERFGDKYSAFPIEEDDFEKAWLREVNAGNSQPS